MNKPLDKIALNPKIRIIWLSVLFGVCYWIFECAIDVFIFYEGNINIKSLSTGTFMHRLIIRLLNPDPNEAWLRSLAMLIFMVFGIYIQYIIIKRQQTQEALRYTEERYRFLAENITDFIWTLDMNMRFTYVSPSVKAMLGYSAEEALSTGAESVLSHTLYALIRSLLTEENVAKAAKTKEAPKIWKMQLEHLRKDKTKIWTETNVTFLRHPNGSAMGILGVTRDATERKEFEKKQRQLGEAALQVESNKKMESMVESMVEGVIMIDKKGEIAVLNHQARQVFGFGPDEKIVAAALKEKMILFNLDKAMQECQEKKKSIVKEIALSDEKARTLRCSITPVKDERENIIGVVMILRDITKEKEIDRMKTEFISVVSHELRTPLTSMREGVSQVLDGLHGPITGAQKEFLSISLEDIDRLDRIVNDLLDISKIESGRLELKKSSVDLNKLIKNITNEFQNVAKAKNISLTYELPKNDVCVFADEGQIRQVISNLISNSYKFTEGGGGISVKLTDKMEEVQISVQDTGIGIARENMPKLFNKFVQFTRVAGPSGKGTGLGLAISKGLIEMHKGRIWVESELEKGSRFHFTIPKIEGELIVKESISNGIREAADRESKLSLVFIEVADFKKVFEKLGKEKSDLLITLIEDAVKETVLNATEIAIKDAGRVFVFLQDFNKEKALAVKNRLEDAIIKQQLRQEGYLADSIQIDFGVATFPDDAVNEEDLLNRARVAT